MLYEASREPIYYLSQLSKDITGKSVCHELHEFHEFGPFFRANS